MPQQPEVGGTNEQRPDDLRLSSQVLRILVLSAIVIFVVIGLIMYRFYRLTSQIKLDDTTGEYEEIDTQFGMTSDDEDDQQKEVKSFFEEGTDAFGAFVRETPESLKEYTAAYNIEDIKVNWLSAAEQIPQKEAEKIFSAIHPQYFIDAQSLQAMAQENTYDDDMLFDYYLYNMGTLSSPASLAGKTVYLFAFPSEGMGMSATDMLVIYDEMTRSFVVLWDGSYDWYPQPYFFTDNYIKGMLHVELGPEAPATLSVPGVDAMLTYTGAYREKYYAFNSLGATNNRGGIVNLLTGKRAPTLSSETIEFTDPAYGPVHFVDNEYRIQLEDGSVHTYELIPSFLTKDVEAEEKQMYPTGRTASVSWTEEFSKGTNRYTLGGRIDTAGCGAGILRQTNVVNEAEWFDDNSLGQVGTTEQNGAIFVLNDITHNKQYLDFFEYGGGWGFAAAHPELTPEEMEEYTDEMRYQEFLDNDPIIFWKDHKDRWRMYFKSEYQSLAECGKPVIYLYPEVTSDVRVEVTPNGGFTYTDPEYPEGGWVVRAEPTGELYSQKEQQAYPYLFWEGHADGFGFSDKGFVFSRETLEGDMQDLLVKTGLNEQEIYDFLEFWLPLMNEKPYVFVTFANQKDFERAAPLTISPRPDSVLRVFMSFEPLDEYKDVEPLHLNGFERRGFTVVEWGGVLQK